MTKDKMKIMTAKPLNAETPIERLRTLAAADATMRQALTCVGRRHTVIETEKHHHCKTKGGLWTSLLR